MEVQEQTQPDDLFAKVDDYDWDNDAEFQGGLQAILGSSSSPEQIAHLSLRARCFYYSRKFGTKVDFNGYKAWREHNDSSIQSTNGISESSSISPTSNTATDLATPTTTSTVPAPAPVPATEPPVDAVASQNPHGSAPAPASFAEICALIAEGKPIPGIKDIPDTVLEGQATASNASKRRKPWEKDLAPSTPVPAAGAGVEVGELAGSPS